MKIFPRVLLALTIASLTACGGGLIRGQPPLVGISALQLESQQIRTRIDIHNPNDVDMEIDTIEMSMKISDTDLGLHSTRLGLDIHPNGTEEIGFDFPSDSSARQLLAELEQGEVNSLPYALEGTVRDATGGSEKFSQQGYLYPVPGRPGRFRGAGPQREQPRDW